MPKVTCPNCGTKNLEDETFCAKCGVRMASQAAPMAVKTALVVTQPVAANKPAGTPKDMRKLYLIIVAAVVILAVLAVYFMTRSSWKAPDIPISQAIAQGYPVICEVRGSIDGIPRNYDIYLKSPKYAAYAIDANGAFLLYNGAKYYTRSLLNLQMPPAGCTSEECLAEHFRSMYDTTAPFRDCSSQPVQSDLNEFIDGYKKMKGSAGERANVTCKIVQGIDDNKFELPAGVVPQACDMERLEDIDYCSIPMPVGESVYDRESDMTVTNLGEVQQSGKALCKFGVTGGAADDCGGLLVFLDVEGAIAAGEDADPAGYTTCAMKYKTPDCFDLCAEVVRSI